METDHISHRLWDCICIRPFLETILQDVVNWTNTAQDITKVEYLFGMDGLNCDGINHFILEAKMFIFYSCVTVTQATK